MYGEPFLWYYNNIYIPGFNLTVWSAHAEQPQRQLASAIYAI